MAVLLMTKAAYARHRGCDEKAVRKAIAENRISLINGKIDATVADIQWAQNTRARADSRRVGLPGLDGDHRPAAQKTNTPGVQESRSGNDATVEPGYQDYRTRRERADAEKAEMETGKMAGRLIERDSTERAIFDAFRQLRDAVMASAQRSAPKIIGLSDVREIERLLNEEQRKAFQGWEERMLERLPVRQGA